MSKKTEINTLEHQRSELLQAITSIYPMIPGSYNEVNRKCGKPNCWCNLSAHGHPSKRITWKERGVSCAKVVGDNDVEWVVEATGNYRKFRSMLTSLEQLEVRLHEVLREHAAEIIDKTREEKKL
jgi:hypothetical protein